MSESHYELIGVESDASKDEIRSAYRERIEALRGTVENGRSDKARDGARAETARLNSAWQVLADPVQRQRYDTELTGGSDGTEAVEDEEEEKRKPHRRRRAGGACSSRVNAMRRGARSGASRSGCRAPRRRR